MIAQLIIIGCMMCFNALNSVKTHHNLVSDYFTHKMSNYEVSAHLYLASNKEVHNFVVGGQLIVIETSILSKEDWDSIDVE